MSRRKQLNKIARRQLESIGSASGARYVAERMEILNGAKKWIEKNYEDAEPDIMDVLSVAEFLAGDRVEDRQ